METKSEISSECKTSTTAVATPTLTPTPTSTATAATSAPATTATTSTIANEFYTSIQQKQLQQQQMQQESAIIGSTTSAISSNANSGNNNNNTNNAASKAKMQLQQSQSQYHQFRTPQQFVRQRKIVNASLTIGGKKNKMWNKRQCKPGKQLSQQDGDASANISIVSLGGINASGSGNNSGIQLGKADVENIQSFKSQIGGIHHYYQHHRGGGGGGGGGGSGGTIGNGLPPSALMEKLSHGHGHLKQQLYKKMLAQHRGHHHHHHVLCAGAAHNANPHLNSGGAGGTITGGIGNSSVTSCGCMGNSNVSGGGAGGNAGIVGVGGGGGGGGGSSVGNIAACCLISGCSSVIAATQNAIKDGGVGGSSAGNNNTLTNSTGSGTLNTLPMHICCGRSKFFLPDKRPRKEIIIPPTKFLLGGNISDPLNLTSLQNEMSNATSSNNNTPVTTPRQSPITTPPKVEVIIPPNIHDPLHLLDPVDSMEYEKQLTSPMKRLSRGGGGGGGGSKQHKHPHRYRKNRKPKRRRHDPPLLLPPSADGSGTTTEDASLLTTSTSSTEAFTTQLLENVDATARCTDTAVKTALTALNETGESMSNRTEHKEITTTNSTPLVSKELETIPSLALPTTITAIMKTSADTTLTRGAAQISTAPFSTESNLNTNLGIATTAALSLSPRTTNTSAVAGGVASGTTGEPLVAAAACDVLLPTVRANRDLRLDLHTTTTTAAAAVLTLGSTCSGSPGIGSGGGFGSAGGAGGGGRKRKISESNNSVKNKKFYRDAMDKIVSPVVPQPGAWKRPPRNVPSGARKPVTRRSTSVSETELLSPADDVIKTFNVDGANSLMEISEVNKLETIPETGIGSPQSTTSITPGEQDLYATNLIDELGKTASTSASKAEVAKVTTAASSRGDVLDPKSAQISHVPKFRTEGARYRYGNYDRYSGFRHLNEFMDVRLQVFQRHLELFQNKDILDIGCNVGHMTITVARNLAPKSILGIDIDKEQIARARRNLAMYVRIPPDKSNKDLLNIGTAVMPAIGPKNMKRRKRIKRQQQHQQQQQQQQHHHHQQQQHLLQQHHQQQQQAQILLHHHHHLLHVHHLHHHLQHQQQMQLHVNSKEFFPISFPLTYGGLPTSTGYRKTSTEVQNTSSPINQSNNASTNVPTAPNATTATAKVVESADANNSAISMNQSQNDFPRNVYFRCMNYVLKDESQLCNDSQQYDVIMCLSVTKWIHLNFGDAGLKLAFKRMFNQLRPGGKLILEAQNWASYKKKKNLTEEIYENYRNIEFFPNKFHEYLLSSEVGFSHSCTLGVPRHLNKGFCRPIQLYAKGDYTPNHVRWSDAYYPQTPYEAYRGIYATMPPRPIGLTSGTYPISSSTRSQAYDTPHYSGGTSGPYSCRQTPMYQPTSQYYNPLETDSYQPSYDMEYLNHMYVFASPLYQTVWSPPASLRNSSSHTPVFGSVRDAELDGDGSGGGGSGSGGSVQRHRHVYPPNDDTSSPNANADGAFNSIRDPDTDDSNQLPAGHAQHVYATNCGESSSSPQVLHHHHGDGEEITLMLDGDEQASAGNNSTVFGCDLNEN